MAAIFSRRSSATSQIAYSSTLRALRQASKWANWEIGPQPSTPILKSRDSFFTSAPQSEYRSLLGPSSNGTDVQTMWEVRGSLSGDGFQFVARLAGDQDRPECADNPEP